jgi:hypothetical protein
MPKSTKSRSRSAASKTRKSHRSTLTIGDIRNRFKEMDETVRNALKSGVASSSSLGKHVSRNWSKLFDKPLSSKAAASLAQHYLNLHGKKKGGSLQGSPLDYVMRPGLPAVATYATFPTEVGADPAAVRDLDVYYNTALGRSCGLENTSAKPWVGIGSNLVPLPSSGPLAAPAASAAPVKGGFRRGGTCRKTTCMGGAFNTRYSGNQRIIKGGRRNTRRNSRQNGGDFVTALSTRQYIANNPAGMSMRASEQWMGLPTNPRDVADPSYKGWHYASTTGGYQQPLPTEINLSGSMASHPKISGVSQVP